MHEWGSPVEIETKRRIKVCIAAYAYEFLNESLISDAEFDSECKLIDLSIDTNSPDLDAWFRAEFHPDTGQWVHKHPELRKLRTLAQKILGQIPW